MLGAFAPWPREAARTELIDHPGHPAAELAGSFEDIARLNRLGPTGALLTHVAPFFERAGSTGAPLRVVDLGTGVADIPAALCAWARARGRRVRVLALDLRRDILACVADEARRPGEVWLCAGDALRPPIRPDGVDLALCSLTLHHLPPEGVTALLRLMKEVSRLGFVVSDLYRSRTAYAAAWLATRAISTNRLTRHDGPLSVRRAYTRAELVQLSAAAGLPETRWHRARFFRLIGVYEKR